jgi:alkylation response protein AidB-like acyl-CoA dehydrogenase
MIPYKAPLREMRFVLDELLDARRLAELPGHDDATPDVIASVLAAGGGFCEEVLAPLNQSGDEEGCRLENGIVRTPSGFREAYRAFAEGGWTGLAADPAYGGQGLPHTVSFAFEEMVAAANPAFGIYPGLSSGAVNALALHGSEAQKALYLPRLIDGRWSGTMCLTEPQCGTDLGLVRSRAEPQGDGSVRVTGGKIFISAGDHDLTENIVHLLLARLPDAPAGTRGLSLFLVPKRVPGPDGTPGPRNRVDCTRLEHKMGIRAAATCALSFDGATGWLVGRPHKGMSAMFSMMNAARLAVGIQGLAIAERAYQSAAAYARERLQGRSPAGAKAPDRPADPLIVHPDIRRMLLTIKAQLEPARALAYWTGIELDIAARHPDAERRQAADDLVSLLTPIVKAALSDLGSEAANLALQVWGGHGYIRENGVEQLVRDARIAQIYEGANGIQALDLVGRKLGTGTGRLLRRFFPPVSDYIAQAQRRPELAEFVLPLAKSFAKLQQATAWVAESGLKDPEEGAAAASEYLQLFALVAMAYLSARMAEVALPRQAGEEGAFYQAKLATARFFMARLLPRHAALFAALSSGAGPLMALPDEAF